MKKLPTVTLELVMMMMNIHTDSHTHKHHIAIPPRCLDVDREGGRERKRREVRSWVEGGLLAFQSIKQ